MRIQWHNILDDASSLTATNESANCPVDNILGNTHRVKFKADANNSIITADFSSDQEVSCLVIGGHNVTSVTMVLKDAGGATLWSNAYTRSDFVWTSSTGRIYPAGIVYFDRVSGVREISLSFLSAATLELGGVSCGVHLEFMNVVSRPDVGAGITGGGEKSRGGVLFDVPGEVLETYSMQVGILPLDDADVINDVLALLGTGKSLFLDRYEGIGGFRPYLANITSKSYETVKQPGTKLLVLRNLKLDFEECK